MERGSRGSTSTSIPEKRKRNSQRKVKVPKDAVSVVKPTNAEEEKEKFFEPGNESYEPQFCYSLPPHVLLLALEKVGVSPSERYVPHALRILNTVLQRFGSHDSWQEVNGGEFLSEMEARAIVDEYLVSHGIENDIVVNFNPQLLARASFMKKASQLNIRPQGLRRHWIQGMLHHEVGTHFLREKNNQQQAWAKVGKKGRQKYNLQDKNPTEEGLASLHTVLERDSHTLWRAALLYYATWRAAQLSFRKLYEDLKQFLGSNEEERWDYCLRAKRGLSDTSQPGGFVKDQMYLTGAMQILESRRNINFEVLYVGKVSVEDAHRMVAHGIAKADNLLLPCFLAGEENMKRYRELLDEIVSDNNLTDLVGDGTVPIPGTTGSNSVNA